MHLYTLTHFLAILMSNKILFIFFEEYIFNIILFLTVLMKLATIHQSCFLWFCNKGLTEQNLVAQKIDYLQNWPLVGSWEMTLSRWNNLPVKSAFICLRPWATQYQLDQTAYTNKVV